MKKEAAQHAVGPAVLGLQYPNDYYDDVLDANAVGQCIFFLFETSYNRVPFHDIDGLSTWGKLFCLAYCYLSRTIQMLHGVTDRQMFETYEARALLTMNYLGSHFNVLFPRVLWSEMVAHDCLTTGTMYESAGYPEDGNKWRSRAIRFIDGKQPLRLQSESLETMAKKGAKTAFEFFKEREQNFIKKKYLCTADEVKSLVAGS